MSEMPRLSVLDLANVGAEDGVAAALAHSTELAKLAETTGYDRLWYAEHHNMPNIGSSAPAVLIAHIAAHTSTIGLGAGGVMLPNHSPLVVAEQFGTLAALHPGRIHLGLGRAPGSDGATFRALRRTHEAAERFPEDVLELQSYFSNDRPRTDVNAYPGRGAGVPLTILGSSLFGAQLAAQLGLPYSFASHFAPQLLLTAVRHYRDNYVPSAAHPTPYVSATVNVAAAETDAEAEALFARIEINQLRQFLSLGRERALTLEEATALSDTPAGQQVRGMLKYTAIGGPERVRRELQEFAQLAQADELITSHPSPTRAEQLTSVRVASPNGPGTR